MPLKPGYACDTPRSCDRTGNRGPLATCRSAAAAAGTLCGAIVLVATSCCGLRPAHAAERAASCPAVAPLQLQHYPQWIHQGLQVLFDARPGYSLEPVREPPLCQQFRAVPRPAARGLRLSRTGRVAALRAAATGARRTGLASAGALWPSRPCLPALAGIAGTAIAIGVRGPSAADEQRRAHLARLVFQRAGGLRSRAPRAAADCFIVDDDVGAIRVRERQAIAAPARRSRDI